MSAGALAGKPKVFAELTGLRGIGAVWVTVFHLLDDSQMSLIKAGYLGVDLFFVLSGFIISHVHAKDFSPVYTRDAHLRFLQLRVARIFPLHVFILALFAAFVFLAPEVAARYSSPERLDFWHLLASLFLVHNWGIGPAPLWNGPTWSLSAEWLVYLAFPFISRVCTKTISSNLVLPAVVMALAGTEILLALHGSHGGMGKAGLVRIAGEFVAGCLIYRYTTETSKPVSSVFPWVALAILAVSIMFPKMRWMAPFAFALLILSVVSRQTAVGGFLGNRLMIFLGEISFSLYLCHWPLIQVRNWAVERGYLGQEAGLVLVVVAVCGASLFCWRYIEIPARHYGRQLLLRREERFA